MLAGAWGGETALMVDRHPMEGRAFLGTDASLFVNFPDALAGIGEIDATLAIDHNPGTGMSEVRQWKAEERSKDKCDSAFHGISVTLCMADLVSKE
jgi:hypothetical protein